MSPARKRKSERPLISTGCYAIRLHVQMNIIWFVFASVLIARAKWEFNCFATIFASRHRGPGHLTRPLTLHNAYSKMALYSILYVWKLSKQINKTGGKKYFVVLLYSIPPTPLICNTSQRFTKLNLICILDVIRTVHCQDYAPWVTQSHSMREETDLGLWHTGQHSSQ